LVLTRKGSPAPAPAPAPPVVAFLLRTGFAVSNEDVALHFRSYFHFYLKEGGAIVYGTCDRTKLDISLNLCWLAQATDRVMTAFQKALGTADFATIGIQIMSQLRPLTELVLLQQPWTYTPQTSSPREKFWNESWDPNDDPLPTDFPTLKTAPSDLPSTSSQHAHIVSMKEFSNQTLWLLQQVPLPESKAIKVFQGFHRCIIELDYVVHSTYDKLHFYFAWHTTKISRTEFKITLRPVIVHKPDSDGVPELSHQETIEHIASSQEAQLYHRALVLRKYLTLFLRKRCNYVTSFIREWHATRLTSECFGQDE